MNLIKYINNTVTYLKVAPNQGTSWAHEPTIFRGLGHGQKNLNFKGVFWCSYLKLDEECTFINIVQITMIFFSPRPYVLLFPKLFAALFLSEQHFNLGVNCFAITIQD